MSEDRIYASENADDGAFEFNEAVAAVFPDMLKRSIPGYAASIAGIGTIARQFVTEESRCYDLGCSLGAATLAMRQSISGRDCRILSIDNSSAMIRRCRKIINDDESSIPVDVIAGDVREMKIENASMVVMNYTMQFLPVDDRDQIVEKIFSGMNKGGVFVLSEKVVEQDPVVEKMLVDLHHEQKKRNAYSDSEISRKRAAIVNVLIPENLATHKTRILKSGFSHVGVWLRFFNFVSMVAIK